jgi:hypothetical protein
MARGRRIKNAAKKVGGYVGKVIKPITAIPSQVTSQLGPALAKQITKGMVAALTGAIVPGPLRLKGSQKKSIPAAFVSRHITRPANQKRLANGNMIITHSEYIGDVGVRNPNNFDLQYQFGLNPGNNALFPWLATIAARFDSYKFLKLTFRYETVCGTGTPGVIMMATDYDAADPAPTQSQQMLSYKNAVESVVYDSAAMHAAKADLHRLKTNFVLTGVPPPSTDIKTYDVGNFFLAVIAPDTPNTLGRLHVDYSVELMTPQILQDPPSASSYGEIPTPPSGSPLAAGGDIFAKERTVLGNLPVFIVDQSLNPGTHDIYVTLAGTYEFSIWFKSVGAQTAPNTPISISSSQGAELFNQYSPGFDSEFQFFQTIQFEVIEVDQPALSVCAVLQSSTQQASSANYDWTILPISSSTTCVPGPGGTYVPRPTLNDPRRRFGRLPMGNIF